MKLLIACVLVTLAALPADAQTRPAQGPTRAARPFVERGFITFGAGAQAAASELNDRILFETNAETGTIDTGYPGRTGLLVEGGAGFRVRRRIGLALTVSRATTAGSASINAEIPHPFFDDRHRRIEGQASGIGRTETAAHMQVYYELRARGPWRVRLFAGPSYFNVEQEVVTDVEAAEVFPYDTAEFRSAATARAKGSGVGFNGGADVSRMFTRRIGAGVLIRYARASLDLNAPGSRAVSTDGGGLQAGGGIRVIF